MSLTIKQLLTFKKTLLQFSRELCEEAQDEYVATMYHDISEVLQDEVNKLSYQARKRPTVKTKAKKRGPSNS